MKMYKDGDTVYVKGVLKDRSYLISIYWSARTLNRTGKNLPTVVFGMPNNDKWMERWF